MPKKYYKNERYASWWSKVVTLYRGDQIIDTGTIKELAEKRGVRKTAIYNLTMPSSWRKAARSKRPSRMTVGVML